MVQVLIRMNRGYCCQGQELNLRRRYFALGSAQYQGNPSVKNSLSPVTLWRLVYRLFPTLYVNMLQRQARSYGLDTPVFVLTFDCDTDRDAAVCLDLQTRLFKAGISAGYAVPGALLEDHWHSYKSLLDVGGYFINHGYRRHAETNPVSGKVYSTFGYATASDAEWQEDIILGHQALLALTGKAPDIFRTPHFGEFCGSQDLHNLYKLLKQYNYRISSSTVPAFSGAKGLCHRSQQGVYEIPLSGSLSRPAQLIDSWGYLGAPDARGKASLKKALDEWYVRMRSGEALFMNCYFDPADISGHDDIIDSLIRFAPWCMTLHDACDRFVHA